jgi:predicted flap endonuclease-1-like 5' DNA nuclease
MEKEIKSFEDLVFKPHRNRREGAVQSQHDLPNGITISVVGGESLYGDGVTTFEVAAWRKEEIDWLRLSEYDEVLGWQSKEQVTEAIQKILKM